MFWNEPAVALEFAEAAGRDGYGLLPGFLRFLATVAIVDRRKIVEVAAVLV
jgi:hypothetical protein